MHSNVVPHNVIIVNIYSVFDGGQDGSSDTRADLTARRRKSIAQQCFFRQISAADGCSDAKVWTARVSRPLVV